MTRIDGPDARVYSDNKEYAEQRCLVNECLVIHFPLGKKNQYGKYLEKAINNLTIYAKSYYYNWEKNARDKFMSYTQAGEIDEKMQQVFWLWYLTNYRFYRDVSPIIDFYFVEYEDKLDEKMKEILKALKRSYLSVYQVEWIRNNAVGLRDIFCDKTFVVERNFGDVTKAVEEGDLLLLRLVRINNSVIAAGKTVIIPGENKEFLCEEINSRRINEQVGDMELFLWEYAEVLCGLVIDLSLGIRENSLKSRSFIWKKGNKEDWIRCLKKQGFLVLEKDRKYVKLTVAKGDNSFKRIYVGSSLLVIVTESKNYLDLITDKINQIICHFGWTGEWSEGFNFTDREEAEEILGQIMQDKYLENWLNTPKRELDGMTPLQAVNSMQGRVLLEQVLDELELNEIKARILGEYYISADVIRKKLKLAKSKVPRGITDGETLAIRVGKFRTRQEVTPYVSAYTWLNELYRQIAAAFYQMYYSLPEKRTKLAWLIFMWNEFSSIFKPTIYKPEWWMAALEYAYSELSGEKIYFSKVGKRFGVASSLIRKNSEEIVRHFTQYPLDFSRPLAQYPRFEEMDAGDKIRTYEEVWMHMQIFKNSIEKDVERREEESRKKFYQLVNEKRKFWNKDFQATYREFWKRAFLLDLAGEDDRTLAHAFWELHASMFPPYLRTAAFNMMMSYVSAYWIKIKNLSEIWLEDIFTGEKYRIYGVLDKRRKEQVIPGMICITRLLPLGDSYWIFSPVFVVMPEMAENFMSKVPMFLEEYNPYDVSDFNYLKAKGNVILQSYITALDEMEQNTLNLINQPLEISWQVGEVINPHQALKQLKSYKRFQLLEEYGDNASFLWLTFSPDQNYQWGYVIVVNNKIFFTTPPGKDKNKLIRDIRRAFKEEDIVIFFRDYRGSLGSLKRLETYMIRHLAKFFNRYPEISLALLKQDDLEDEELEVKQGIFLLKLGARLMECLKEEGGN
ncbi:MbcA/ParS/Xre antitoxin family protein [Thermosyntropha lipolytica]|nr:MbcA/ParS/Xre antitoxin family protein [Thermosyntropha lipolytica]